MKRHGASKNTDVRKRTETRAARPFGPLTDEEIEDIRRAYLDGCRGEVIIGLRGDERMITMLVPSQFDSVLIEERIQALGCNGFIHISGVEPERVNGRENDGVVIVRSQPAR